MWTSLQIRALFGVVKSKMRNKTPYGVCPKCKAPVKVKKGKINPEMEFVLCTNLACLWFVRNETHAKDRGEI